MAAKKKKKAEEIKELVAPKKSVPAKKETKLKKRSKAKALVRPATKIMENQKNLKPASPHRSFRRTRRRDYARSLELPGYFAFTASVWRTLWRHRPTFIKLVIVYAVLSGLLVGFASQGTYNQISEMIREAGGEIMGGDVGRLEEVGLLLMIGLSGGLSPELNQAQQLMSGLLVLLIWLTTIWLLRAFLAGHSPRLRDGLYNSGAPIVPTMLLSMLLLLQLIPAAIAMIGISAAIPTGLISGGVEAMLFWVAVLLLLLLSLYWVTSSLMALVVVTLPGMYPLQALKAAHELVVGRRARIVLRIVWLAVTALVAWLAVIVPAIIFDAWIKGVWSAISWLPIVPVALLLVSSASVVWVASYIYLLYRKVVDDDAAPA